MFCPRSPPNANLFSSSPFLLRVLCALCGRSSFFGLASDCDLYFKVDFGCGYAAMGFSLGASLSVGISLVFLSSGYGRRLEDEHLPRHQLDANRLDRLGHKRTDPLVRAW